MVSRLAVMGVIVAGCSALQLNAQEAPKAPPAVKSVETAAPAQLSSGVADVLKLVQAKTGDEIVIAFIGKSTASYSLGASEIIYLREQGVSDVVISAMLKKSAKAAVATAPAPAPVPAQAEAPAPAPAATSYVAPATTANSYLPPVKEPPTYYTPAPAPVVVQSPTVYVAPPAPVYYYPSYYPSYDYYYAPPVSLSFGFGYRGGYYHGGGGYYHGGGGFRGGHR